MEPLVAAIALLQIFVQETHIRNFNQTSDKLALRPTSLCNNVSMIQVFMTLVRHWQVSSSRFCGETKHALTYSYMTCPNGHTTCM